MPAAWGAAIGAVGTIASSAIGSSGASSAAGTQANAANQAAQVQQNMFNTTQGNLAPWLGSGMQANNSLAYALGYGTGPNGQQLGVGSPGTLTQQYQAFNFDPTQIANNPQYQWQMGQGLQALNNSSSVTGGVGGNQLQALVGYGQGLASQNYNNYFTNAINSYNTNKSNFTGWQQQVYNMLAGQSAGGQNAAANLGGIGTQVAQNIGGDLIGAGNATAAGQVGSANALSSGLSGLGANAQMYQQMANNPSYTNPIQGIGNWLSGANYNGMQPNVSTAGSAIDGGVGAVPY